MRTRDPEAAALIARAKRVAACEREVFEAIEPILQRHHCHLATVQQIFDGQPGPVRIVVAADPSAPAGAIGAGA